MEHEWTEIDVTRERGRTVPENATGWKKGELLAIVSTDAGRLHLSISTPTRLPTWEELGEARDRFFPGEVYGAIPMPPREYWMNVHPYCLHLYEVRDSVLARLWRLIGMQARGAQKLGLVMKGGR